MTELQQQVAEHSELTPPHNQVDTQACTRACTAVRRARRALILEISCSASLWRTFLAGLAHRIRYLNLNNSLQAPPSGLLRGHADAQEAGAKVLTTFTPCACTYCAAKLRGNRGGKNKLLLLSDNASTERHPCRPLTLPAQCDCGTQDSCRPVFQSIQGSATATSFLV